MKKLIAILCVLMMMFASGCYQSPNEKPADAKTESTADDDKYYDKDTGKIILKPVKDEEQAKEEEKEKEDAPKTEKADFSGSGTLSAFEAARGTGTIGSAYSTSFLLNNTSYGMQPSKPETIAGLIFAGQLHHMLFKDSPAYGNTLEASGNLRCDAASNGNHSGAGHRYGYAADIWSNQIIALEVNTIAHPKSLETAENLADPYYGKFIRNKIRFKQELEKAGISVLDEVVDIGSKDSNGPHLHVEFGKFKGGGLLFNLFDGLKNIGDVLSVIINRFSEMGMKAYKILVPNVVPLLWMLAIIDFCLTMFLRGIWSQSLMEILFEVFIPKMMKYAAIYGVIVFWPSFINAVLDTVNGVNEVAFPDHFDTINQNISQPQLVMQKGFDLIRPGFDFISMVTFDQFIASLLPCLLIFVSALFAMAALMALAIYVTVVYLEFFIGAGLSVFLLPFGALRFVKFLAEGASSWLVNCGIKLMTLTMMIGITVDIAFKSMTNKETIESFSKLNGHFSNQSFFDRLLNFSLVGKLAELAKARITQIYSNGNVMTIDEQLMAAITSYMVICGIICMMCYLVYRCTDSISNWLQGQFSIPD